MTTIYTKLDELIMKHGIDTDSRRLYSEIRYLTVTEDMNEIEALDCLSDWLDNPPGTGWPRTTSEITCTVASYDRPRAYLSILKGAATAPIVSRPSRQAIHTKFLGPTDYRGARIKATCDAGSITVGYDHALDTGPNHAVACETLIRKLGWERHGRWVGGSAKCNPTGFVFVCITD